jgi:type VII secretion protein EssA
MKKQKVFFIFSGLLFLFYSPFAVSADSDGSLQLNSGMITTQSGAGSSTSDFAIRSQLFSKDLDKKAQEKVKSGEEATKHIDEIDFNKESQNKLYKANYQSLKTELFKNYIQTNVASNDSKETSKNNGMLILLIMALPLMILTGVVARNLTRRKRRK